jgi:hypothetical protein
MVKQLIKRVAGTFGYVINKFDASIFKMETQGSINPEGGGVLADNILSFTKKIDLFYEKQTIPSPLQIGGAWKNDLIGRRKVQSEIYKGNHSSKAVAEFHENMFFNELISGLWNYGYLHDEPRLNHDSIVSFLSDLESVNRIFPAKSFLISKVPIAVWGHRSEAGIVKFTDIWHSIQANHIVDVVSYLKIFEKPQTLSYIEIGSGFGGLAEKLANSSIFDRLVLFDIPHNLITAYYYLGRCIGGDSVRIVSTREEFEHAYLEKSAYIILCPTCFYDSVCDLDGNFVFGNFGSFSEMDYETVRFYLGGLPKATRAIVQINSNEKAMNTGDHTEVSCDEFPYKDDFVRVYGGQVTGGAASGGRYKVSVHLKPN